LTSSCQVPRLDVRHLVGVTYLFGIASYNGTAENLVQASVIAVRGRTGLVPWTMFFVPATLAAVSAAAPAACAVVIRIALKFAAVHKINPVLLSMMVIQGPTGICRPTETRASVSSRVSAWDG
jgi:hypothetical protein